MQQISILYPFKHVIVSHFCWFQLFSELQAFDQEKFVTMAEKKNSTHACPLMCIFSP